MHCPACNNQLHKITVKGIELDACTNYCGGVWFDRFELKHFDEIHEKDQSFVRLQKKASVDIDPHKDRNCPKCLNIKLMRHYFGPKRNVEVDECAKCGGIWLDVGELHHIHESYPTEEARNKAVTELFHQIATPKLEEMRKQSQEDLESAKKFARMFRFLCPSWYVNGMKD